ncbi:AraC family transcriptional regulator [Lactobacillus plantarum] [Lactiplantibacillus mudanjiangensis]|uniref:AraC family transcriptional regulator n=1 Tax=Lactiplantibacillus mudanjiangensis TaxID=1296538 RepID=UPI001014E57A|nr:AraC family transcriptional regulator [Lactobacillus plantarum] [Lactiplantibacillus mudanjiangensis]
MAAPFLNEILAKINPVEQVQLDTKRNYNYTNFNYLNDPIPQMPQSDFFKNGDVAITKNNRFSYVPAHTHSFIEINYMYSGSCTQYINGEKIVLHQHNLILMDKDIVQQIDYTDKNDLLVNILIKDDSAMDQLFDYIPIEENKITQFLYNASRVNTMHNNFILFNLNNHDVAINAVESLIIKGLTDDRQRNRSMGLLLSTLIIELSQSIEQEYTNFSNATDDRMLAITQYINTNFNHTSLAEVSEKFSYNPNYLGNKIKESTGHTFKELLDHRRLSVAQNFMIKTNCTLSQICENIGYENTSSLFRLFKKYLQTTPSAYKKKVSGR